mmetsp:Transcript_41467/g.163231  ORF Transcript_41467/g.163231 Transcript_41467/m.163231 type:complete len:122 (-) Transcript_41467:31-396(-)
MHEDGGPGFSRSDYGEQSWRSPIMIMESFLLPKSALKLLFKILSILFWGGSLARACRGSSPLSQSNFPSPAVITSMARSLMPLLLGFEGALRVNLVRKKFSCYHILLQPAAFSFGRSVLIC